MTLLTQNGVGYKVFLTKPNFEIVNEGDENVSFFTHLNVKEDSLDIYGFRSQKELELFELLISLSGIGPKAALGILSLDTPDAIAGAILRDDPEYLTKVSGIGKKTAQKIAVELKDKVLKIGFEITGGPAKKNNEEVYDALFSLGYKKHDIQNALKNIPEEISGTENMIKEALKHLGRN